MGVLAAVRKIVVTPFGLAAHWAGAVWPALGTSWHVAQAAVAILGQAVWMAAAAVVALCGAIWADHPRGARRRIESVRSVRRRAGGSDVMSTHFFWIHCIGAPVRNA